MTKKEAENLIFDVLEEHFVNKRVDNIIPINRPDQWWLHFFPSKICSPIHVLLQKGELVEASAKLSNTVSIMDLITIKDNLNALDVIIDGCGDDFGGSIGHQSWLQVTFIF